MSRSEGGGFYFSELENGWEVGRFRALDELGAVIHAVTTRRGPDPSRLSGDPGASGLAEAMKLNGLAWSKQVHGCDVRRVEGGGFAGEGDAMVTDVPSLGLVTFSADCPLILAAEPAGRAIGVAHASWRGTVGRIASKLIARLTADFRVRPEDISACVSPSAGPCCYQVGPEVRQSALEGIGQDAERFFIERGGKTYFDLWSANREQLARAGVLPRNIHLSNQCTICNNERFSSYRVEGDAAGRFAAVLALRPPERRRCTG